MKLPQSMPEFRCMALKAIEANLVVGFDKETLKAALDEVMAAAIEGYMNGKEPTACQKIMAHHIIRGIEVFVACTDQSYKIVTPEA